MSTRYFLALDGLKGDSLNSKYKGWFEVSSFDIDLASAGASTAAFSPLTLTLDSNSGLAPLLALAATGERLSGATLVGVTDGAGQAKVYQLDLADVLVTNVEHHADSATEAGPTLTLDYSKIELETFTPDGTGGAVPEGQFGFDLTANMAGITVPSADPGGSVAASPEPRDYFMLIDGLNGGSLDKQHIGWFDIRGVDLDMEKLAAGDFASLNVTVPGGVELADVMKMAATGSNLASNGVIRGVHIEGFTAGKNPVKVYDLTLANVAVSDVTVTNAAGSDSLEYSLSLDYSKIALVTNGIDGSGQPIENGEFGYDVTTHTKIAPFSLGLQLGSESAASGSKYFLALDNVRGDLEPAFKGPGASALTNRSWFEVNSFDIDMEGRGLPEAGSTQKVAFSPLTLTLDSNTALAPLLTMAATGDPNASTAIKAATLVGVKSDGQTVSYRLDLGTLQVTNVEDVAHAGLTVSLDFGEIKLWTFTQDKNGVVSHANDFTWNVLKTSDDVSDMPSVRGAAIAPSPEPATYFMLIDGLNGGSTDASHKGWFELSGFDFDLTNPTKIGSASGGAAGGKPQFSPLNVTLPQEAGLADVMGLAATGGLIKGVRIEGVTGGTTPAEVYELTLADVAATKVADGEDGGYSLSLDYGKIALVTKTEDGKQTTQFTYDVGRNAAGVSPNPSSLALSPDSSGGSVTPAKYFLALDGVKGDSLDSTLKGWFEVSNFDLDLSNPLLSGVPGSSSGQLGKAAFSPLTLTLDSNTGLAPLLTMAATGGHLNGATLVGVTAGAQAKVYQLDLADVLVTKVEDDAGAGLTLGLDYSKIELETFTQNGTSGTVPEGQFGFDRTVNTGGITVPSALPGGTVDPSPQPARYFMLIDGLNGGSQDTQHKGWFEITGFDLDLEHVRLPARGEANFSPLNVTLGTEVRLAEVMDLAATGGQVKGVRIEGVTGGATPAKVFDLTLADVTVTKVVDGENDGYSLSLDYGKIALVTDGIDATGQRTTNGEFGFDVTNDIEIDPFTLALSPNGNHAPAAVADAVSIKEDAAPNLVVGNVLTNDQDADGDTLAVTNPGTYTLGHGSLALKADGSYAYTLDNSNPAVNALNDGQTLADAFTYQISDGHGGTSNATLTVTIRGTTDTPANTPPAAFADAVSIKEDTVPNPVVGNVLTNDQDADGDTLAVTNAGTFALGHGSLALKADGSYAYTLDNSNPAVNTLNDGQTLTDAFTYQISDGHGGTSNATLTVTIRGTTDTPANIPPTAFADAVSIKEDTVPNPVVGNVLTNDQDVDGDTLAVTNAGTFALGHGSLALKADGSYAYTLDNSDPAVNGLNDGQTLADAFTYQISDGHGGTSNGTLTVTIRGTTDTPANTPPAAFADAVSIKEDTVPNPVVGNVLTNDQDADGDTLTVTNAGTFALGHGSLALKADGSYAYTLDNSNPAVNALNDGQTLADAFTYQISDGHGGTSNATLTVTIRGTTDTPANTPPAAFADAVSIKEDTVPNPVVGNVLTNDQDADGDTLAVTNAGTFALGHGSLALKADGSYAYTLDNSNPAVNTLNDGQTLTDAFTYQISDGHGGTSNATLTVTIRGTTDTPANIPPTAFADAVSIKEDTVPNPVVGNVLTNDQDVDGDTLAVTNAGTFALGHGSLALKADGSYAYTLDNSDPAVNGLNDGQTLADAFTYQISDGHGGTSNATLTVTIRGTTDTPANTPPAAFADAVSIKEDTVPNPVVGNVLTNDQDADGDTLTVTNAGTFALGHGSLALKADGSYAYTLDNSNPAVNALNDGQTLADAFTYQISDGHGGTSNATLTVTIRGTTDTPANIPPTAFADAVSIKEDTVPNPVVGNVLTNDQDVDGDTLTVTNAGTFALGHGSLALKADGSYAYTLDNSDPAVNGLNDGQTLTDAFTYQISDGHGGTSSAALTVTIRGTTDNTGPTEISTADVQKFYLEITRTRVADDAAVSAADLINSGAKTEAQVFADLIGLVATTTIPAIAVEATMYGAVGSSTEVDLLVNQFIPSQEANALKFGFNPIVYVSEALGLAFAFGNEIGSTAFGISYGPTNSLLPNTAAGDASFASAAINAIFGAAATPNLTAVMDGWVANWKAFYTEHGLPSLIGPSGDQIDLAARAAAWGDAVGVALDNDLGPLKGNILNFLMDAAHGLGDYSMPLVGQPMYLPDM